MTDPEHPKDNQNQRNQSGKTLRESEKFLTILTDALADAVFTVRMPERRIEYANRTIEDIFGYSPEEVIGQTTRMFYPDEDGFLAFGQKLQTALAQEQSQLHTEHELLRRNGDRFWADIATTFIHSDGELFQVISIVRDITERKQTEDAVIKSEEKYRTLIENSTDMIFMLNAEGNVVSLNETAVNFFDDERRNIVGLNISEIFPHKVSKEFFQSIETITNTKKSAIFESKITWENRELHLNTRLNPILDSKGAVTRIIGISRDTTEFKKAEEALQYRLKFEMIISKISTDFINMSVEKIEKGINEMLKQIAKYANAVRSSVFLVSDNMTTLTNTHEWCASPADSQINLLQGIPFETFGYYRDLLLRFENVIVNSIEDLPPDKAKGEREWSRKNGFRSLLFAPMIFEGELYGALGFYGSLDEERIWSEEFVSLLRFVADIVINALERKGTEKAMNDMVSHWQTTFDSMEDSITLIDKDSHIVRCNMATEKFFDLTAPEIIGRKCYELIHGMPAPFENCPIEKMKETHLRESMEFETNGKWLEVTVDPIFDHQQNITSAVHIIRDITERMQAEDALQKSQKFREALLNATPDIIYIYDIIEQKNIYSNEGIMKILGYSIDEIQEMGNKVLEMLIHPDDFEIYLNQTIPRYLTAKDGELVEHEYRMKHKNGQFCWLLSKESIFTRQADGTPQQIIGIVSDITERKKAEETITHSHDLMRYIIEHTRSDVAVHDRDLNYIYVSQSYLKDYNVKEQDVIGKHHYDVFPDLPQKWRDVHQKVLKGEILSAEDDPYVREDGTTDWTSWECRPWYEADGSIGGLIVYTEITTERKQAEAENIRIKNFYESILESIINGVWVTDDDDVINYANRGMGEIAGIPPEQIVGARVLIDFPEGTLKFFKPYYLEAKETLQPVFYDSISIKTPGGQQSYQTGWLIPQTKDGKYSGMICTVEDVTKRKLVEEALKESEEKYRLMIMNSPDMILLQEEDGRGTYLSPQAESVIGYKPEEMINIAFPEIIHSEDREMALEAYKNALKGEELINFEYRIRNKSDEINWLSHTARPIIKDGELVGIQSNIRNITQSKHVEEALKESEEKFRTITESSPDAIFITDQKGNYAYVNQASSDLLGYSVEELTKMNIVDISDNLQIEESMKQFQQLLEKGHMFIELNLVRKDGSMVPTDLNAVVLPNGLVYGSCRDMTERKLSEEKLKANLREKEILLKEIHHRVKNNLQIISSLLDLQSETLDEELKETYKVSQNRIKSMALIHENLYRGGNLSSINVKDYITELIDNLQYSFDVGTGEITINVETSDLELNIDTAIPIGLIVNELISNCYKHAFNDGSDGGKIDVSNIIDIEIGTLHDEKYFLKVKDNGIGLPENINIHETSTLGLQLVSMLVQQLKGSLELNREVGTEFYIVFQPRNVTTMNGD